MTQPQAEQFCALCRHNQVAHVKGKCMMPGCQCLNFSPGGTPADPNAPAPAAVPALPEGWISNHAAPASPGAPSAPVGSVVAVPADCIVSPCKVSPGRFVPVVVPLNLTSSEAKRLVAFIMAQADDAEPETLEYECPSCGGKVQAHYCHPERKAKVQGDAPNPSVPKV